MPTSLEIAAGGGSPAPNVGARIADEKVNMGELVTEPWVPDWIEDDETDAFADVYEPQYLAALSACVFMFAAKVKRVWVHLAAEMQAGKTGVIATVARLILANKSLNIGPSRIFVLTGMSDDAWQTQTAGRMPNILRRNVHHGPTLSKVKEKLSLLRGRDHLKNVMIFIDESHHASAGTNQPAKQIYDTVANMCPRERWAENNIRFMTISATDPAKVIAMKASDMRGKVVPLLTTDKYQGVEKLQASHRIRFLEQVPENGVLHTPTGFATLTDAVIELEKTHGPLVHILRPQNGKGGDVVAQLHARFPRAIVHQWDVASNKEKLRAAKEGSSSGAGSATDINEAILNNEPTATTFVVLKGMFRAAKTLNDRYVGVLYDSAGKADATNLQSLLGRACGYGKSTRTIVFASQSTVTNYLRCWRDLCASEKWEAPPDTDVAKLGDKMPHTKSAKNTGGEVRLVTTASHATPFGHGIGAATAEDVAASARASHDDNDYAVTWSDEFASLAALKASGLAGKKLPTPREDGFFKDQTGGKKPMTRGKLMALKAGKKTAQMRGALEVGEVSKRTFPFYDDPANISDVKFVVRTLTRLR